MPSPTRSFLSKALLLTAVAVALGALPLHAWAGGAGLLALLLAAASALAGAAAARLPRRWLVGPGRPYGVLNASLAGIGVRMLTTAAIALVLIRVGIVSALPFALSLVAIYLVLLVLEVREAVAEVSRMDTSFEGRSAGR